MSSGDYSRIYHELSDEFPDMYDGPDLAAYVRLLVAADQAWPSRARWAGYTDDVTMARLVLTGLVIPVGEVRYTIKGLDNERQKRSDKASKAGIASAAARSTTSSTTSSTSSSADPRTSVPRKVEPRRDKTRQDEQETSTDDPLAALYDVKAGQVYEDNVAFVREMADDYGDELVASTIRAVAAKEGTRGKFLTKVKGACVIAAERSAKAAEDARKQADAEYQRKERERAESMPLEERKANMQWLREKVPALGKAMP